MKNVNIMVVHQKEGLGQFAGGLAKNSDEGVFEGEVDTLMHTMT